LEENPTVPSCLTFVIVPPLLISADRSAMPSSRASSLSGRGSRSRRKVSRSRNKLGVHGHRHKQPVHYSQTHRSLSVTPSQTSSELSTPAPSVHFAPNVAAHNDDFLEHVIVAVDIKEKDRVGCAYYIAAEARLLCMEEVMGGGNEVVEKRMTASALSSHVDKYSEARTATDDNHYAPSTGC
jgi:hypothetical protein